MRWTVENIRKHLIVMPMMAVVVPLVIGIAFADAMHVPTALWGAGIAVCLMAAAVWRSRAGVWLCVAMMPLGAMLCNMDLPPAVAYDSVQRLTLRVDDATRRGERYNTTSAEIVGCGDTTFPTTVKAVVYSDTTLRFAKGDRLTLNGTLHRFGDRHPSYASLMYHRRYVGTLWIGANTVFDYCPAERGGLHEWAVGKLSRLVPQGDAQQTLLSMAVGERTQMSAQLRRAYARSGASHLLAVSGLHVGIVFLLVNVLLAFVPLVRNGNLWRCAIACAAIWAYVLLCGTPPSAVRAAVMFTALQAGISFSREAVSINTLAGAAFAMLVCAPRLLFDIGFLLSFTAVAGIILWGIPLCRRLHTRHRAVNALVGVLVVGFVATLATLPLVSHTFGLVSVAGVLLNPIVVLLANVIVLFSVASLLLPAPIATLAVKPAMWCAEVQNAVVESVASLPWSCFDYRCPGWAVYAIYAVFVVLTLLGCGFGRDKTARLGEDN